jgi:hypothetical protein
MKRRTNFDKYLAEQLQCPAFASRFKKAGQAWDVALRITPKQHQVFAGDGPKRNMCVEKRGGHDEDGGTKCERPGKKD